jgi:26S proteasome regulatory subunit (ATPase 3-interacting protein)
MEEKLVPMRASKGTSVSASEMKKMEDEFVKHVELWGTRRRNFNDALGTIMDSTGQTKKKLGDELGFEWDDAKATEKLDTYKKTVDTIKRKRAIEARQKKFKRMVA